MPNIGNDSCEEAEGPESCSKDKAKSGGESEIGVKVPELWVWFIMNNFSMILMPNFWIKSFILGFTSIKIKTLIWIFWVKRQMVRNALSLEFLKSIFDEQLSHEKNGDYVKAEECRLKFEKNKNDRERKTIHDMQVEHKKQQDQLTSSYNDEVTKFNEYWDNKLAEFDKNSENMVKELSAKHQMDQQKTRDELDKQLSLKVKESSDLLNLRKM